jgi:hypothetical protein
MQIAYHLGVHCTDEDRLLRCLLKNRGLLAAEGIAVPGPKRYRVLLRDAAAQLRGRPASGETQAMLIDQILDEDAAERMVLSWDQFMGLARYAARGALYPSAGERMRAFAQVFPEAETEFHLAICNPASFLPAVFARQDGVPRAEFLGGADPLKLRWSDTIADLRAMNPSVPVTVWCDEDAPILWPEVLQSVAGHGDDLPLVDALDRLTDLLTSDGAAWLAARPPATGPARRAVLAEALARHARPGALEVEIEMEGFDATLAAELTAAYEADVAKIAGMAGVQLLTP